MNCIWAHVSCTCMNTITVSHYSSFAVASWNGPNSYNPPTKKWACSTAEVPVPRVPCHTHTTSMCTANGTWNTTLSSMCTAIWHMEHHIVFKPHSLFLHIQYFKMIFSCIRIHFQLHNKCKLILDAGEIHSCLVNLHTYSSYRCFVFCPTSVWNLCVTQISLRATVFSSDLILPVIRS